MDIVFFSDACFHLARCTRTIGQPRGNMLMVGVSGVGRKSIARMGAHMADYRCASIEITRTYGSGEFKEDLKQMMLSVAKSGGKGMVFLFSDTQIVKEGFLEDVNNILNTGEVPNLFAPDELEQVIGLMRPVAKAAGRPETKDAIWQYFVQVIRENMHIVLAFSPIGEGFRARCRQFPSIINCASIDWFSPWPVDALQAVAERHYGRAPKDLGLQELIPQLSSISSLMHSTSKDAAEDFYEKLRRQTYMTPTSYLELIGLFIDLVGKKRGELTTKLNRYTVGSKTLAETQVVVDELKIMLTKMQPEIEQAKKDTAALMIKVEADQAVAKEKSEACAVDETNAAQAAAEAGEISADCQKDLDEALPEYYSAIKSLESLDKKDIQEVKSFAKPPPLVEVVLSAVCLLMGQKETWDDAKKLMNDSQFLTKLKEYDKEALANNAKLTKQLQKYIKREDFTAETVKKVSAAAMSLCMWVRAMDVYGRVAREIEPKKLKLAGAEEAKANALEKLTIAKAELKIVLDNVASLEAQLSSAKRKAAKLEEDANDCVVKLDRAEKLLAGLGNESVRWSAASQVLEKNLKFVIGNIVLAGGFIAYTGAFTAEFRRDLASIWIKEAVALGLETDPAWRIADVLVDPAEVRQWNIWTLPADDLSVENGIMVTRGRRWPLMIDPQGQANRWCRSMGKEKSIIVTKLTDPIYLRKLEACIRNGHALLIENVEEVLDPAIEPVLNKAIFKRGGQLLLRLGTEDVPYSEDFAFYITTKMANPHYLPEVCIKVTIINFTVTLLGLQDQLVVEVVASERPDLAQQRTELVVQIAADKKTQDDLEQLILKLLADAEGDVLKDDSLIVTLDQSKKTGTEIEARMEIASTAMAEIEGVMGKLRPVATRASILYFVVADLANIDPMYQYSLEFFVLLFQGRLKDAEQHDDVDRRIDILIDDFTRFIYSNICRGLFEDHKLLFSFLVTVQILRNKEHCEFLGKPLITPTEWLFFLRGIEAATGILDEGADVPACPEWVYPQSWPKLDILERLTVHNGDKAYEGLCADIAKGGEWKTFCTSDAMTSKPLPGKWAKQLNAFEQMLVVKSLRENFFVLVARNVVGAELGGIYTESPPFDLSGCFRDSMATAPLIFVLSAGADPTEALLTLAKENEYGDRLHFISLGQGQGPKAEAAIAQGTERGLWVVLQNCHLAPSWMPTLEVTVEELNPNNVQDDFRLWLTAMPSPDFPVSVLQNGLKVTNEPPKGLKASLLRAYTSLDQAWFEEAGKKSEACQQAFRKMLFGLCFFHALIQERCTYGALGWNIPYQFSEPDRQICMMQLRMFLEENDQIPYDALRYTAAEANYGGRVTDVHDRRAISFILTDFYCPEILKDDYKFSPSGIYYAPSHAELETYVDYIRGLPINQMPEAFGLHANANLTASISEAMTLLRTANSLMPRTGGGEGMKSNDEILSETSAKYLADVPQPFDTEDVEAKYPVDYNESMNTVLNQELLRFNKLTVRVRSTLADVGKAVQGLVVMSDELQDVANGILNNATPAVWMGVSYPSLKPLSSYVLDLCQRLKFFHDWIKDGIPGTFWISGFYFTQSFLTGQLQNYARKFKLEIDTLIWNFQVLKKADTHIKNPSMGCVVHGLFIDGARWDDQDGVIAESLPKVLCSELPSVHLVPCQESEDTTDKSTVYHSPVYKTSERKGVLSTTGHSTNFVMTMKLPIAKQHSEKYWTKRGVACLTQLDD